MKLVFFFLLLGSNLAWAGQTYAQITSLNLDLNNVPLEEVFDAIRRQSEFEFFYNNDQVNTSVKVSVKAKNADIKTVLEQALPDIYEYKINDRYILINKRKEIAPVQLPQQQTKKTIIGKITDKDGGSVIGANIIEKGTTNGTVTDVDGSFTLSVESNAVLHISYIGYLTQDINTSGKTDFNIVLQEDAKALEEVVIVGYGSLKKENLTGAVSQVKMEKILGNRPITSLATALQGAIPGLQITQTSGQPGTSSTLNIRGTTSINGGSPLVLVDNVPMNIEDINPADVDVVSVLKDASASSIYGGRAAWGVILITTKKGQRNQQIKFNYSTNFTTSSPTEMPEKASTLETIVALQAFGNTSFWTGQDLATWSNLLTDYKKDPSKYPNGETFIDGVRYRLEETDLYKKFMTNSFEQMHNFSFSGGSEKADYRVSFGYSDEDGILITDKDSYKKYNVNVNLSNNLTDKLTSTLNILYDNTNRSTPAGMNTAFDVGFGRGRHIATGYYTDTDGSSMPFYTPDNILKNEPTAKSLSEDVRIMEKIDFQVAKTFKLTGEYTFMKSITDNTGVETSNVYMDGVSYQPITLKGAAISSYSRSHAANSYNALNLYATFERKYGDHSFKILAGTNQELSKYTYFSAQRLDLLSIDVPSLATATGTMSNDETFSDYVISGYFSRLNYMYKDKYLFEANVRYDGSSRFPKGSRYGTFPSFSAGWIITEESFMKPIENYINLMKIRCSWGEIGNQDIANYAYIPTLSTGNAEWIDPTSKLRYLTANAPGLVSSSFTWETVRTSNLGVDMSFLNRRLNTTFDYFNRKTLNMLGPGSELPKVIGASAALQNVADLESKGWEASIEWKISKPDYGYSLGVNVSDNRAFITKFDNEGGLLSQRYNGYEFGEIWGYVTNGYYTVDDFVDGTLDEDLMNGTLKDDIPAYYTLATTNPGDIRYADLDDDGKISPGTSTLSDPGDRKIIGNNNRRYQFGITGSAYYKNFDLSFLIQGVGKRDIWFSNEIIWPYITVQDCFYKNHLDYWTPDNTDAFYPRNYASAGGNTYVSRLTQTKYLLNGAYIKLKNVELGYTLPKTLLNKFSISRLRLFVSGENLLKLDHLPDGVDTEAAVVVRGAIYPYIKKISVGLNLSF